MSIELDNFDLIKIQKDSGVPITFRFQDSNSVDDIDFALRNVLSIQKNLSYSLSYKNKNTGQDIYIVANGSMLLKCLKENINQLDLFVTPRTPASLSSSPSNSNSQERDNLVQRWPELMKNIDRRIQRWTSRSVIFILLLYVANLFISFGSDILSGKIVASSSPTIFTNVTSIEILLEGLFNSMTNNISLRNSTT
ncbi:unnamed protein product [Rotaria magnacalcarata]|uniref:Uncharacterized protein n=1 Tax=Rotaria magnacalcarata TaxID=392030 RepID=A0A816FLF7_9BILA|nr:unnamed protein product [Rotaria magnacalcarata]CAF1663046.1 unnamed protein product [Rotaria magnacalcarata]CAF2005014.1 unnamed protein product [Rotaria magnacalcarata]CAF2022616.1 unnamed protein product [Rotaria magnacalcarata]